MWTPGPVQRYATGDVEIVLTPARFGLKSARLLAVVGVPLLLAMSAGCVNKRLKDGSDTSIGKNLDSHGHDSQVHDTSGPIGDDSGSTHDSGSGYTSLDQIPADQWNPVSNSDGLPSPLSGVYTDEGAADSSAEFRSLIGFPLRNADVLANNLKAWSDPTSGEYRNYPSANAWVDSYAPTASDFSLIHDYLEYEGFSVNYEATNRLLIQFSGTVGQFNTAFNTTLHDCSRVNPESMDPPVMVYCTVDTFTLPGFVADITNGIITADYPVDPGPLPNEVGSVESSSPGGGAFQPTDLANAYGVKSLWDAGYDGSGVRLGVTIGGMFKYLDLESFWTSTGITRDDPTVQYTMEDPPTRNVEATVDVSWSGGLAPGADLKVYVGPDSRNTSMVYDFNEAIGLDEVDIITDSFAHREDSEPKLVRDQYDEAAMEGASLGITLAAASGDSGGTDIPCSSPYVTCVGGTVLDMSGTRVNDEYPWYGGEGDTKSFDKPDWQSGITTDGTTRAVTDVSASAGNAYWVYYIGAWYEYEGTSFSSPVFAGAIADADSYRIANGKPLMGFLNPVLYTDSAVQASFRDVTRGSGANHYAQSGWDYPTGWGGINAQNLATAWP